MRTAMIFAAGRGERLKPITDDCPKALCAVDHIPLIEYHVSRLALVGFERIIINHAYLGGQIRRHLGTGARWGLDILYSPEPPGALETGGGVVNALSLLGQHPFITVNADIFTDYDFSIIKNSNTNSAHLVLVPTPYYLEKSDFRLSKKGRLDNSIPTHTFSGIACFHPHIFKNLKLGRYSIMPLIRSLATDKKVTGEIYLGQWCDVGSPDRLTALNANKRPLLNKKLS
jgi:MurNAc alpha-1-phosphate uridylyltransferase